MVGAADDGWAPGRGPHGGSGPVSATLDSAPMGVLVVGRDLLVSYANRAAERLLARLGWEPTSLPPERLLRWFPSIADGQSPQEPRTFEAYLTDAGDGAGGLPVEATLCPSMNGSDALAVVYLCDVGERKELRARYEREVRKLGSLRAIDIAITGTLDLRVTLDVILDHITTQLGVHAADVLLFDERIHRLAFGACRGFHTDALRHTSLPLGKSYAGKAALDRRTVTIADLESQGSAFRSSPHLAREGFAAYCGIPLIAKGHVKGVLELFHRRGLEFEEEWLEFAQALAQQAAIAIDNASLLEDLQRTNSDLSRAYDTTLEGWSRALDLRDRETEGHSERVTELSVRLAREIGMNGEEIVHVRRGALLHDIGKMGIPDAVLLKPGPLSPEEWEIMRRHPEYASELLGPIDYLRQAMDIPSFHHERWDGTGYPHRLAGQRIPVTARIFALADVWDAVTSERPYRARWPKDRALEHIKGGSGTHFDPRLVDRFVRIVEGFR